MSLESQGPDVNRIAQQLALLIQDQIPGLNRGAMITAELYRLIRDILKKHLILLGSGFLTAGFLTLLPSLLVVAVNALGFTAAGVLNGSIAAAIQSLVYGGATNGLFAMLQSFGASAIISPPGVIAIGVTGAAVGCAILGYKLWKWHKARGIAEDRRTD